MSIELLELAADALGPLLDEVVFVGGATVTLWITDPGAPPVRPTKDVDVVVEVATRSAFHDFEARLRERRFAEDQEEGIICRWRHPTGLILDAMPTDATILGFENRWQSAAVPHAIARQLPSGTVVRAVSPPWSTVVKNSSEKWHRHPMRCAPTSLNSWPTSAQTSDSSTASTEGSGQTPRAKLAPRPSFSPA